ncbi:MAG TPA: hypothetical protein VI455_12415, partial [Terriglobia bacterium]
DYLWQKEGRTPGPEGSAMAGESQPGPEAGPNGTLPESPLRAKKLNPILIRQRQERRNELEEEIARCETEIATCELDQAHFKSAEESIRLAKCLDEHRTRLGEMMKEWEQIAVELEEPGKAMVSDRE